MVASAESSFMSDLILVKHAAPEVVADVPSCQWSLSESGRLQCHELARRIARYAPTSVFASEEAKAAQTAQAIAHLLDLSSTTAPDLHENDRNGLPFLPSEEAYHAWIEDFFLRCDDRVMGRESANQAHARFVTAVQRVLRNGDGRPMVIVTHGTVATLLVTRANKLSPFPFWRELRFGSLVVLSTPGFILKEVVHPAS
jgi:broad specificity phosphatase PhoE